MLLRIGAKGTEKRRGQGAWGKSGKFLPFVKGGRRDLVYGFHTITDLCLIFESQLYPLY